MNIVGRKGLDAGTWKDLYLAAIFESNLNKLPGRIADAEAALVICARDRFYAAGDDNGEVESVDAAMSISRSAIH
jgi:hypothetical protein